MEKINELPSSFLMEIPLSEEQIAILLQQMNRFYAVRRMDFPQKEFVLDDQGKVLLEEGMLIHGVPRYTVSTLENICKTGILTGQAIGVPEDGETFYCADFHRISRNMSMKEFNENFSYVDGRCPFGNGRRGANSFAFLVRPIDEAKELLAYDCYRDGTKEAEITRSFTNCAGLLSQKEQLSSILYGVPSNLFCGVVLGNRLLEDKKTVELVVKMFPKCYLLTIDGVILYNPNVDKEYSPLVQLRAEKYVLSFQKRLVEDELESTRSEVQSLRANNQQLLHTMIVECPSEDVARILLENRFFQGTMEQVLEYIERVKSADMEQKKKY